MKKLEKQTEKAIKDIPKEIRRLSKVVATVGKIMVRSETVRLEQKKKKMQKIVEEARRDVT